MAAERVEFEVGDRVVKISNPDRVYFSERGETKLDLARYYLSVADGIVNALYHRPCMLHRFPDGVDGEKVHQKRLPAGAPPWIETVRVHFPRFNRDADELCVNHPADVIWAVQMSTVEFHPWNSRRDDTESPDEWRIDLDPMPLATYADVRRVSVIAQEVLAELGAVGCRRHPAARDCISTSEFRRLMVSPMYDAQPGPLLGRSSGAATAWSTSRGGARTAIPARSSSTTTRTLVITRSRALIGPRHTSWDRLSPGQVGRDRQRRARRLHYRDHAGALR